MGIWIRAAASPDDRPDVVPAHPARGLVGLDPVNPLASVVAFQYKPDGMTRTLQARAATGGSTVSTGARSEALRLK